MTTKTNTITRKNLLTLKGTAQESGYYLTLDEFLRSPAFRKARSKALVSSLSLMGAGFLFPLAIGFFAALPDRASDYFQISVVSNAVLATIFCLPLSIFCIAYSLPLYKKLVHKVLVRHGFVRTVTSVSTNAA